MSLKVFQHKERDTIFLCRLFHLLPITWAPDTRPRWASESQPSSSDGKTQLTFLKSQPMLPVCDVTHIPGHILNLGFLLWHLWMTRPLRAHVNACAHVCTLLTHALSRKVLSLTKPKGKIYKTKSLGYYITMIPTEKNLTNSEFNFLWFLLLNRNKWYKIELCKKICKEFHIKTKKKQKFCLILFFFMLQWNENLFPYEGAYFTTRWLENVPIKTSFEQHKTKCLYLFEEFFQRYIQGLFKCVQPFWISQELVVWAWCNLKINQRGTLYMYKQKLS